jgi:phage terminase large subunit GpA-like protein
MLTINNTGLASDLSFLREMNNQKQIERPCDSIAEFVEKKRVMPPGTPLPGPVDLSITPYAVEWLENMSPYSPIQHQVIKKSAQVAATFSVEGIIGFWMSEYPTAIMYLSGTRELLEEWGNKRLEPMITSCGIRDKIIEHAENSYNKKHGRSGDKIFSKQFVGGFLKMVSAQAASAQRSDSIRLLIRDEIESAPKNLRTGEGSYLRTTMARTKFFGDRKKVTDLTTPALKEGSYIDPAFEEGDQRLYMMRCPMCKKYQPLDPIPDEGNHGLRADSKAGKIIQVYYLCDFCHDAIFESHKTGMFEDSKWEPTAVSKSEFYRSYYINSLYAPVGTFTWKEYYDDFLLSKTDPELDKTFHNLTAGLSYIEKGERPKINTVQHLRGDYKEMTIPDGVLYLTATVDVQRGSEKFEKLNDSELIRLVNKNKKKGKKEKYPRLELEILGHGAGYKTWSISYKVFNGKLDDIEIGAWERLRDFYKGLSEKSTLVQDGMKLCSIARDDGMEFDIPISLIDSRDGTMRSTVATFCQGLSGFYPCMGSKDMKKIVVDGDKESAIDVRKYRPLLLDQNQYTYIISSNYYKKLIYMRAKIERVAAGEQRAGFMDHPKNYGDNYFKMLFAEEQLADGTFHAGGRANECLDLKVYNMAAGDIYMGMMIDAERAAQSGRGMSALDLKNKINARYILDALEERRGREKTD